MPAKVTAQQAIEFFSPAVALGLMFFVAGSTTQLKGAKLPTNECRLLSVVLSLVWDGLQIGDAIEPALLKLRDVGHILAAATSGK